MIKQHAKVTFCSTLGETACNLGKADNCVYAGTETPVVQISSGAYRDSHQPLPRLQSQHLSPQQALQYSQVSKRLEPVGESAGSGEGFFREFCSSRALGGNGMK